MLYNKIEPSSAKYNNFLNVFFDNSDEPQYLLEKVFKECYDDVVEIVQDGMTVDVLIKAWFVACAFNTNTDIIKYLSKKVNPDYMMKNGYNGFLFACTNKNIGVIKYLNEQLNLYHGGCIMESIDARNTGATRYLINNLYIINIDLCYCHYVTNMLKNRGAPCVIIIKCGLTDIDEDTLILMAKCNKLILDMILPYDCKIKYKTMKMLFRTLQENQRGYHNCLFNLLNKQIKKCDKNVIDIILRYVFNFSFFLAT